MDNAETVTLHPVKIQKLLLEILPAFIGRGGEGMVGQFTAVLQDDLGCLRRVIPHGPDF